jgi:hypothetical protein
VTLEAGDHGHAATLAEGLRPEVHPFRGCQAMYWVDYGRALARLRGRHDDAVMALLRAEKISPRRVHRNPLAREVIVGLLARSRRDSPAGRELRRMAYRAGLPVLPIQGCDSRRALLRGEPHDAGVRPLPGLRFVVSFFFMGVVGGVFVRVT